LNILAIGRNLKGVGLNSLSWMD